MTQADGGVFFGNDPSGVNPDLQPLTTINATGQIDITGGLVVFDGGPGAADLLTVATAGSGVRLNGPVTLDSDLVISTNGGNILFTSAATVDSRTGENNSLALSAGSGSVTFNADLGAVQPLGTLTIAQADGGVFIGGNSIQPLTINTAGHDITIAGPITLTGSVIFGQPALQMGTIDFESTIVSEGTEYNNLTIYAGTVDFHGNVGRLVPDPVGNPDPNLALGMATIEVSGAINIDPGVEIRVWHENLGIPGGVSQITPVLTLGPANPPPGNARHSDADDHRVVWPQPKLHGIWPEFHDCRPLG